MAMEVTQKQFKRQATIVAGTGLVLAFGIAGMLAVFPSFVSDASKALVTQNVLFTSHDSQGIGNASRAGDHLSSELSKQASQNR